MRHTLRLLACLVASACLTSARALPNATDQWVAPSHGISSTFTVPLPNLLKMIRFPALADGQHDFVVNRGIPVDCGGRDDTDSLTAATVATEGNWVVIGAGRSCVARTMTIPKLRIEPGGLLKVVSGNTITITENFEAGVYQTFGNALPGQGTIVFAPTTSLQSIYPQWWGAKGNGSTDDTQAVNSALLAKGSNVFLPKGSYKVTSNLAIPACAAIVGAGRDQSILVAGASVSNLLKISSPTVLLANFQIDGAATTNATGIIFGDTKSAESWGGTVSLIRVRNFKGASGTGIRIADALKSEFSGIQADGNGTALLVQAISVGFPTTVTFRNSQFFYSAAKGVKLVDGHSLTFDGCVFESNREEGVLMLPASGGTLENINFVNGCWFEDNAKSGLARYQFVAGDGTAMASATIRPVLRDAFFAGNAQTAKAMFLNGPAVAGFIVDNVQTPNIAGEIRIQGGAYGVVNLSANLDKSVVSKSD